MHELRNACSLRWRVYSHIVQRLAANDGRPLRLMVQASAGTGKSFLLTTVFLWAIINGMECRAAAPTGIAAANIEVEQTKAGASPFFYISFFFPSRLRAQVAASTLHSLFDLGANNESKLDFTKRHEKVLALLRTAILLLDEVSMIDCDIFEALAKQLGIADHTRRGTDAGADEYGEVHLVLFGDMKQLPPATSELGRRLGYIYSTRQGLQRVSPSPLGVKISEGCRGKPPFISIPRVYQNFDFRVLRQNRRVVSDERRRDELEMFHQACGGRIARSVFPSDVCI